MRNLFLLLLCVLVLGTYGLSQSSQRSPKPQPTPEPTPKLDPLSEDEKKLDFHKLLMSQPDYVADEKYFYWEGFGGYSVVNKAGKKGSKSFKDTGGVRVLADGNRTIKMHPETKQFEEEKDEGMSANDLSSVVRKIVSRDGNIYIPLGVETVSQHPAIKVEVKATDSKNQIFLYFAKDLQYLVIACEIIPPPPYRETRQLFNISLEPPDELFELPAGYTSMPQHRWKRVTSAKVLYDNRAATGASVFRSEDGNIFFVTLKEPHPATGLLLDWSYLVFVKERFVEVGYQGTLMTDSGEFAWQTDANLAVSKGDEKPDKSSVCDKAGCPKVLATANSLYFPSVYWEDRKSMVKVTW